ncbi:MAG: L-glutamate gamma-semialdehyde dehydrogenase [Polyangiaceae bacterium]|nr:L-glutamate gamma-semialdehyde dehydrogenase [Polyangiaceae bacterium]
MLDAIVSPPLPINEPVFSYAPGSPERAKLKEALRTMSAAPVDIPMWIDGKEVRTGNTLEVRSPHNHSLLLGHVHQGSVEHVHMAIEAAKRAQADWAALSWADRSGIFLKAAELLAGPYRSVLNGATMLGQSKTAHQAEIDSACELIDFFRFNVHYAQRIASEQPQSSAGVWNMLEPRPLEGFVLAATPFNFTAIAGNLPTAPALMGNTVVWKPSALATYSAYFLVELFKEAGLPNGVINVVQGSPEPIVNACLDHPDLAGVHFTGSTPVFQTMWKRVGANMARYKSYPRLVGETGGKDFVFAHRSADVEALAVALVRGAYEYQGQKCSAASRAYIPASIWPKLRARLVDLIGEIKMGDVSDFRNFMGAVIGEASFRRMDEHIQLAKASSETQVLAGGTCDKTKGFFVAPTLVETTNPAHVLMERELFGPLLCVWVYPDADEEKALDLCDSTSPYALTGALFSQDRGFLLRASRRLRFAAGNLYINDKPTGAVVGQQPFGGGRASGTNDKAGSVLNLYRWISPRTVKENFTPPKSLAYPFMTDE